MAGKQEKKKAGAQASSPSHKRKIGETFGRLPEKKLRNILRCNGVNAAKIYAEHFGLEGILKKLLPTITDGHLVAEKRRRETFVERRNARRAARREAQRLEAEMAAVQRPDDVVPDGTLVFADGGDVVNMALPTPITHGPATVLISREHPAVEL